MDDDMEDEIICQFFTVHFHLLWKFVSSTSSRIYNIVIPGTGASFTNMLFQPGLFMTVMLLLIISSIFLHNHNRPNWLQKIILSLHRSMTFNVVRENSIKNFVSATISSSCGDENVTEYFHEGATGVYAIQGRRGNMEDRFCIMQQVDVGGHKNISLFGVYDGHGGQYVAEYVKENLFTNTIKKIKQLRKMNTDLRTRPNKNGMKKNSTSDDKKKSNGSLPNNIQEKNPFITTSEENISNAEEICKENVDDDSYTIGSKVQELKDESCTDSSNLLEECTGESLKKEDPYKNVILKKKCAMKNVSSYSSPVNEKESDIQHNDSMYIDSNLNINYTKLLTDQILDIDKKLVDHCKSKLDLSGTTAVIAVLDGEHLIVGNVGDSRAVMGDLHGSTIPLSIDHKPNQLKEMRRIKEAGGFISFTGVWRVAGILATSRALGDFPLKDPRKLITAEPDVLSFSLKDHKAHFVVLATDGLWDVMSNEEVVAFVRDHIEESDFGAKSLVMHAYNNGSMDNITAAVLNISKLNL